MRIEDLDKFLTLRESDLFRTLDFSFLAALADLFQMRSFRSGADVFNPSMDRISLYLIIRGSVVDGSGKIYERTVGLMDLYTLHFENRHTSRSLFAGPEGCELYHVDGRTFLDIIQELPGLALHLMSLEEC